MSFKSFKNEFTEVYNYLSAVCKDPVPFLDPFYSVFEAEKVLFDATDDTYSTIYRYKGSSDSIVKVPKGVKEIGCYTREDSTRIVFAGCIPPDATIGCFENHKELQKVILPSGLSIIGSYAFYDCDSLEFVKIPNSVSIIGRGAFLGSGLQSIIFPSGLTSISDSCCLRCFSLTSITIPNSVTSIGEGAFKGCVKLKSIDIPKSIKTIADYAFSKCSALETVTFHGKIDSIEDQVFFDCDNLKSIYVPLGSYRHFISLFKYSPSLGSYIKYIKEYDL